MMAGPLTLLEHMLKPFSNLVVSGRSWPRFRSTCDATPPPACRSMLSRYKISREKIQPVLSYLYRDGIRFVLVQGGVLAAERCAGGSLRHFSDGIFWHDVHVAAY